MKLSDQLKIALYHEISSRLSELPEPEDILLLDMLFKSSAVQSLFQPVIKEVEKVVESAPVFEESSGCVFEDLGVPKPEELDMEIDMSELEQEIQVIHDNEVVDVTDDMIVEVSAPSTPLSRLEGFLNDVQSYKAKRPSLH